VNPQISDEKTLKMTGLTGHRTVLLQEQEEAADSKVSMQQE
jgi:hypothetical protein